MTAAPYPNPIHISLIGINATHESGYTVDRRIGSGEYLFEFFDSPVLLQDENGRRSYDGNVFILYSPGHRQYFRADGALTHTWFQISGSGVEQCLDKYQIPVNRAIETSRPDFLTPLLEEARRQMVRKHRYFEDAVTEVGRSLLRHLARTLYQSDQVELSPYQKHMLATLHSVRAQVYKDLQRRWTVDDMAALANMSAPRFAVAYSSHFGIGPIDDLIDVRLRHAEVLLRHLSISVLDAALLSGFNTASNFHVRFRERMGRSPTGLRRGHERAAASTLDPERLFELSPEAQRVSLLYLNPVGYWSFDRIGATVADELGKHPPAVLHVNATHAPGCNGGHALRLDGASHAVIPEAVVDTSRSYTVTSWLLHDKFSRMTAISIGNVHHGAFYLQYIPAEGGFKFAVTPSAREPMAIFVVASEPSEHGRWYHVAGVHDRSKQEIRLYVDGALIGTTPYKTAWRTDGETYLGCSLVTDRFTDYWTGMMDDVRIYDRALSGEEMQMLYQNGCRMEETDEQEA